jgi:hypothetical protein
MKLTAVFVAVVVAGSAMMYGQETTPPQQTNPPKAGTKTPIVHERQKLQHQRIKQGIKSGELTKGEAAKLHGEEKAIQAEKRMAKADGKVTKAERAKLRKDQNKASRDIYKLKHNTKTQANPKGEEK